MLRFALFIYVLITCITVLLEFLSALPVDVDVLILSMKNIVIQRLKCDNIYYIMKNRTVNVVGYAIKFNTRVIKG